MQIAKPAKKPTIKDVAKEAGVSVATVSNVLKGKSSEVSEATAERILGTVKEMGYVKNLTASALSGRKTQMIALVVIGVFEPHADNVDPEINPFYGELLFRLERAARDKGYSVCLYTGTEDEYIRFLLERNVDAAVLVGLSNKDLPTILESQEGSIILFDSFLDDTNRMNVRTDEVRGGELAAEHLIGRGCKKIAFMGDLRPEFPNNIPGMRCQGARRACEAAGVSLDTIKTWIAFSAGAEAAQQVIDGGYDGVVTAADVIAAGLCTGLQQAGKKIPDDVAVVGYDNSQLARMCLPALTTIDQGLTRKVSAIMELVENGSPGDLKLVEPHLVERESA